MAGFGRTQLDSTGKYWKSLIDIWAVVMNTNKKIKKTKYKICSVRTKFKNRFRTM